MSPQRPNVWSGGSRGTPATGYHWRSAANRDRGAAPCRARQHAGRARLHGRRSQHRLLQRSVQGDVRGAARSCCSPAGPIPISCVIWRRTAITARATSTPWSRSAWRACAIPSGKSFEDHTPDGRWYRIRRRRVAGGGTVTVMTDITEQKQAEQELADKEAQLHVALDNMPGALVYTDEQSQHRLLQRSLQGDVPGAARSCCSPAVPILISCAIWPRTATTARATSTRWSPSASRACAIPRARASRTTRRTAGGTAFAAAARRQAARSR